ncbi:uncharacterized protein BT62DRAFT_971657 [Guyanagaster necrorhizus]|uniref:Uncharacterized protein n=1 Tax=Guyanagaster necrorhizus TaxID=856835 RepID=A0A9P8AQ02_9AGAR|nr:uncharacterized protein BT62DRAFT_971657 [Guyanagaster necrorhizus MCA 3950]KAG7443868.1 hypothetical protein BT62DRAFT_971657 [Guyanagaster necrorhizus MCA 3950]
MNEIPQQFALTVAFELEIFDSTGSAVKFGSLLPSDVAGKVVVVFIRHFFCGSCKQYVEQLASVPKESLDKSNVRIIIIGCGHSDAISVYKESTKFPGQIYADPSRKLYHALGMNIETLAATPAWKEKRSYLKLGTFSNVVSSIFKGPLQTPGLIGKQGNISQLGGDFVFGPGKHCIFASRMQHTEDHVEVSELMKHAGVDF